MNDESGYKAGDKVRFPGNSIADLKFRSIALAECYGYENEICSDSDGCYIHIIKKHDIDSEIENNVYQIGELKISHFCNRKVAKSLIKTILENGFTLTRSGSDDKYVYHNVIKIVEDNWQL